jgi:hypothetical protein
MRECSVEVNSNCGFQAERTVPADFDVGLAAMASVEPPTECDRE